jgi:hypothetical protein
MQSKTVALALMPASMPSRSRLPLAMRPLPSSEACIHAFVRSRLTQARIDRKRFAANQPSRDAPLATIQHALFQLDFRWPHELLAKSATKT